MIRNEHLVMVTATEQDTLQRLAQVYLGDAEEAWRIADYNQVQDVQAGQRLIIPLQPIAPGGLRPDGYQVVPVLYYPRIGSKKSSAKGVLDRLFEEQVQFLRENGYETVSLKRFSAFMQLSGQLPPKAILITFDSAERWVYEIAYPVLKRSGFTAAIFVPTAQIGKPKRMSWKELASMAADGFDIGAAGTSGRALSKTAKKTPEDYMRLLEEEISRSRKSIAQNLSYEALYFAYPGGHTNDLVISLLKKHGYHGAFTQEAGENPCFADQFKLRRTIIGGQGSEKHIKQLLTTYHQADLQ